MSENITRRRVLHGVAAGTVATGITGTATADPGGRDGKGNRPDRHIVGLEANASFDVARRHAKSVHRELDFGRIGKAVAGRFPEQARKALEKRRQVRYVEEDGRAYALAQTLPWGVDRIDADILHDNAETGSGADIAIIDTGIDSDHPDLQANLGSGRAWVACDGSNGATCNYDWDDDNDHGTHCAGIADAVDNSEGVVGVSTEATLHALKVLDSSGGGSFSDIAAAIEYTADQGWDVASLSLGASSGNSTLQDACQYAYDNGVLLVAAAGNDGPCTECVGYPAAYDTVVAVSSTDSDDSMSSFSSTGSEVELAAPGGDVYSTVINGYDSLSGTSMACPHVSGVGGQLMANGYTNTEARSQMQNTAEDLGHSSNEQGYGLVDAEAAVLDDGGGGDPGDCVDANQWPDGTGYQGYEYIQQTDMDGQVVESSSDDAYYDFTCPDVVQVEQGGSFEIALDFEDAGYDSHYGNVFVDWDQNGDWSTAAETRIFENVSDDTVTYTATVDVPSDAPTGQTLGRVRLSYDGFDGPSATGEYGEVNDFTVEVVDDGGGGGEECADANNWPDGTGYPGYEYLEQVDMDGQVVEASSDDAYYDFTCPDVVNVSQGGSFDVAIDYNDAGYDDHYANVYVDWYGDGDWSNATEYRIFSSASDDTVTYTGTIDVPSDAATGATLARVRLSWQGFDGPTATDEYGEVNDFTIFVE